MIKLFAVYAVSLRASAKTSGLGRAAIETGGVNL